MQISRMFEIVYILLEKKQITAKKLAEHFEVSPRTIYRDIDNLCQAGIPLYTSKGRGGGIQLMEHFTLNKSLLSKQEREEILWALQGVKVVEGIDSKETLSKMQSILGFEEEEWIKVDFSGWNNYRKYVFDLIKEGVTLKKVLEFDYYNTAGEKSHRQVEPLQIWFKEKAWYMKGFCRKSEGLRLFKLTRIQNLKVLEEHFKKKAMPDMDLEHKQIAQENIVEIKLQIDKSQGFRIYDEFVEEQLERLKGGDYIATLIAPEDDWIYSYILSYGPNIKVLSPKHIEDIILNRVEEIKKLYT